MEREHYVIKLLCSNFLNNMDVGFFRSIVNNITTVKLISNSQLVNNILSPMVMVLCILNLYKGLSKLFN